MAGADAVKGCLTGHLWFADLPLHGLLIPRAAAHDPRQCDYRRINMSAFKDAPRSIRSQFDDGPISM
jgi:hypothetical protein